VDLDSGSDPAGAVAAVRATESADGRVREAVGADAPAGSERVGPVLAIEGLTRRYRDVVAVAGIDLAVARGSMFGLVGPNGAGKTTTLSMIGGLLRPSAGRVLLDGEDLWRGPRAVRRRVGMLPDRLRLFDRLTGRQLLFYAGVLRGLDRATATARSLDLAAAFGLDDALDRPVADYSTGMAKKVALAGAMIHTPALLVLDEPFEAMDPVSTERVIGVLERYAAAGGTVVLSSHSMELVQRVCDSVAIVVHGEVLASGGMAAVCGAGTLEERFVGLAGGHVQAEGLEWLGTFSD
jgi:ABC-type multidrug transport system ATPase subunit